MSHHKPCHNLPTRLTSFIGRERELTELARLLIDTRLVTLVGTPGVGKTRLSLESARGLLGTFSGGVWLVELAPLTESALVPQAVATALGLAEQPGRPMTATLTEHLRGQRTLLLLDNCEHLIEACASLAEALLRTCPDLRVLATSREPLRIEGETTWGVASLAAPVVALPLVSPDVVAGLVRYPAARLFVERARAALPSFQLTDGNAASVARICSHLDGIPLALELAAVRVRSLTVEQIEARLDDRFRLLTAGSRVELPRHQTLRALVDWSHALLSEPEQVLLRRLAVFSGGWTLEAAEAVCEDRVSRPGESMAGDGTSSSPPCDARDILPDRVLDLLSGLVDKSLVLADERSHAVRYQFLETIRAYAREKLEQASEGTTLRDRHRDWFLSLAERAESGLEGVDQVAWLDRLEAEQDNLRAALAWRQTQPGETGAGLRLAGALAEFWEKRGYATEALGWLEAALVAGENMPAAARAKALAGLARLATLRGETERPRTFQEEALALYRGLGDTAGMARSSRSLGIVAASRGDYEAAASRFEESIALYRAMGDERGAGIGLMALGWLARGLGDDERANFLMSEGLTLLRTLGDERSRRSMTPGLNHLGLVACAQGDFERATALLEEGLALSRELGDLLDVGWSLRGLADVARERGEYDRAMELYRDSVALHREREYLVGLGQSLVGLARLAMRRDQSERAVRLFAAVTTLRDGMGRPPLPVERAKLDEEIASLRARLGDEAFAMVWAEGQMLPLDSAIACGLDPMPCTAAETDPVPITPAEHSHPAGPANPLTRREHEVAALIARGLTNRQIAADLVISERTVDGHVARVLAKLDFATRAQIAAWMAHQGLAGR